MIHMPWIFEVFELPVDFSIILFGKREAGEKRK